jgi:hypothetical protein
VVAIQNLLGLTHTAHSRRNRHSLRADLKTVQMTLVSDLAPPFHLSIAFVPDRQDMTPSSLLVHLAFLGFVDLVMLFSDPALQNMVAVERHQQCLVGRRSGVACTLALRLVASSTVI